ncbi:putative Chitin synthase [Seiridium cardinale]
MSFFIFAIVQLYLFRRTRSTQRRGVDFKLDTNGSSNYVYLSEHYSDVGSFTILVTAVALFGTFVGVGIVSLGPRHLITSWAQYLFISSSYVNIPKAYAFSSVHDVDHSQEDVDAQSEATVKRALTPFELDKASVEEDKEETL